MTTDYKVGELIYDANIYDGLNACLSDLLEYLNSVVVRVGLLFQLHRRDIIFVV